MRNEPIDLTPSLIRDALARWWRIDATDVTHAPLGFGSYHWVATRGSERWFVTADRPMADHLYDAGSSDAVFARLDAALCSVADLAQGGLEFILAPIRDVEGAVLRRLAPTWAMAVYPYIEASPAGPGPWPAEDNVAREAARIIARLHAATPPTTLPQWSPAVPFRAALESALQDLETPWTGGPYSEQARVALQDSLPGLRKFFARHDLLVGRLLAGYAPWVVSHGEPHSANFLRTAEGRLYLMDWDTLCLAPRERDAFFMSKLVWGSAPTAVGESYREVSGGVELREYARELFDLRWDLSDVCVYVQLFRGPHADGPDEQLSWSELRSCLEKAKVR